MHKTAAALALVCTLPCAASAGEIFGTIKEAGKPVGAGVKLEVVADGKTVTATTDADGGYRLFIEPQGKFPLTVHYKGKTPSFKVLSFEQSTRYDLLLQPAGGDYTIKRQ